MLQEVINQLKENNFWEEVFNSTFEEWRSLKNHRFMNVNVHTKDDF